jgi:hypothetical protein
MLGKLYKHEMKALNRFFIPLYIGIGIAAVLFAVMWSIGLVWKNDIYSSVTIPFAIFLLVLILIAVSAGTQLLSAVRFYQSMVSGEGYLTHTLPVTTNQILLAKGMAAMTYEVIALAAVGVMIGFFFVITLVASGALASTQWNDIMSTVQEIRREMESEGISFRLNVGFWLLALLSYLVGCFYKLVVIYLAVGIAQSMKGHKILWSTVYYICLSFGTGIIMQIATTILMTCLGSSSSDWIMYHFTIYEDSILALMLVLSLGLGIVCYVLTHLLFNKRLNLE